MSWGGSEQPIHHCFLWGSGDNEILSETEEARARARYHGMTITRRRVRLELYQGIERYVVSWYAR